MKFLLLRMHFEQCGKHRIRLIQILFFLQQLRKKTGQYFLFSLHIQIFTQQSIQNLLLISFFIPLLIVIVGFRHHQICIVRLYFTGMLIYFPGIFIPIRIKIKISQQNKISNIFRMSIDQTLHFGKSLVILF